jgi:putative copper export protein
MPATHVIPASPQGMLQPPQLFGSVAVLVQPLGQRVPDEHVQALATQVASDGHTVVQEPQWLGSVAVFTHAFAAAQ